MERREWSHLRLLGSGERWGELRKSWTAAQGDFRNRAETLTDADGAPVRFPDEEAACRWAWQKIESARSQLAERAGNSAAALADAQLIYEHVRRLDEAQGIESPFA